MLIEKINLKPKNLKFFVFGAVLLLFFLVVLLLETRGIFSSLDPKITIFLQANMPRILDVPLSILSLLGSFEITSLLVLLLAGFIYRRKKIILYSFAFFGIILLFEFIGKLFLVHPGPPKDFFRFNLPFYFPSSHVQTNYSFPSGHVGRTFFLVVVGLFMTREFIAKNYQKFFITGSLYLLAFLMMVSRIYLGEHWTSDVLGGLFLGCAMGFFTLVYY